MIALTGYEFKFEVDKINGIELLIMEVELADINSEVFFPSEIEREIIYEITGIDEFSNYNLAKDFNI